MPSNKNKPFQALLAMIFISQFFRNWLPTSHSASNGQDPVVFKLEDLVSLYEQRLLQLGAKSPVIHSTRLKEKLLSSIIELEEH